MIDDMSVSVLHAKTKSAKVNVKSFARSKLHSHWVAAESDLLNPILVRTYHY